MGKKKKLNKMKPRTTSIMVGFKPKGNSVKVNVKDGKIVVEDGDEILPLFDGRLTTTYERENKNPKTLVHIPTNINAININRNICEFDIIFAVDTNTIEVNNVYQSIGIIIICELDKSDSGFKANYKGLNSIETVNEYKHPFIEQVCWKSAIEYILDNAKFKDMKRIGLVVDCDLGNIEKYNSKEIPIYGDFYLPNNFQLIYASADSGNENLPNKLIKCADSLATEIIKNKFKK